MVEKVCLNLLLLCGILSQGVIGNLAHENIREPSDILIRQKRVINCIPAEEKPVVISRVPFIVHIKENMCIKCVGSILSSHVVITIAACVLFEASRYNISSASSHSDYGTFHNVIDIRKHFGNHPQRHEDGVALLTVATPFVYGRHKAFIQLHSGPLLPGMHGTVYGWGFNVRSIDRGTSYPTNLRSIEVPIMSHWDCVNKYRPHNIEISDMDICTFHQQRYCGHTDGGAPLVVDGYLAGVHLWTGPNRTQIDCRFPDVFVILQHSEYKEWITSNVRNIEANFSNHH